MKKSDLLEILAASKKASDSAKNVYEEFCNNGVISHESFEQCAKDMEDHLREIMPLIKGKSDKTREKNIKKEIAANKPIKQAVAIGYAVQREAEKKKRKK